jgi:hypothetical protein
MTFFIPFLLIVTHYSTCTLPAIGVEDGHLVLAGFDNVRMAVAHVADVVDAVQELGTRFIVHVLA